MTITERVTFEDVQAAWDTRPGMQGPRRNTGAGIMRIARVLDAYIEHVEPLQALSIRLNASPGQVHHYRSLATRLAPCLQRALSNDLLRFKVARALTRVTNTKRQVALGAIWINGLLSSVHAESAIKLAVDHPRWNVATVYKVAIDHIDQIEAERITPDDPKKDAKKSAPTLMGPEPESKQRDANDLAREILWTAGAMKMGATRRLTLAERTRISTTLRNLRSAADELEAAVAL